MLIDYDASMFFAAERSPPLSPLSPAYLSLPGSFTTTSAKPAVFLQAHLKPMNYHLFALWLDIREERVGEAVQ